MLTAITGGCSSDRNRGNTSNTFAKASIERASVRPEDSHAVVLTGDRLYRLLQFFPEAGTGEETGWGASGLTGIRITFYKNNEPVNISVTRDMQSWSEGHGSHTLDPAFANFIADVLSSAANSSTHPVMPR
jgi:hypothetical protein